MLEHVEHWEEFDVGEKLAYVSLNELCGFLELRVQEIEHVEDWEEVVVMSLELVSGAFLAFWVQVRI